MKIKFEDEGGWCVTPCPFGYKNTYTDELTTVGSNYCSGCKNFISTDTENNIVECKGEKL